MRFIRWLKGLQPRWLATGLCLLLLSGGLHYWIAPLLIRLPADYTSETAYAAETRFRSSPTADWQAFSLTARRVDQALTLSDGTIIILGEMHWTSEDDQLTFESTGLYGVHRESRANQPGYGNLERTGQYLFPPHLEPGAYEFWDPFYIGPRTATFARIDHVDGVKVYVFDYVATDIDETAGYAFLPDIPERYKAHTDGAGSLWIEPISGIVVDFEDAGVTHFVDARSEKRVAELYIWQDRYTPETKQAQLQLARRMRLHILALESWVPAILAGFGLFCLALAVRKEAEPT